MLFSEQVVSLVSNPPAVLEDWLDCFLVWVFVTEQSGMGGPTSSYATASIPRDSLDHTSPTTIVKVMQSPGGDDLHLQDVLLNIAQCVIHTCRVFC